MLPEVKFHDETVYQKLTEAAEAEQDPNHATQLLDKKAALLGDGVPRQRRKRLLLMVLLLLAAAVFLAAAVGVFYYFRSTRLQWYSYRRLEADGVLREERVKFSEVDRVMWFYEENTTSLSLYDKQVKVIRDTAAGHCFLTALDETFSADVKFVEQLQSDDSLRKHVRPARLYFRESHVTDENLLLTAGERAASFCYNLSVWRIAPVVSREAKAPESNSVFVDEGSNPEEDEGSGEAGETLPPPPLRRVISGDCRKMYDCSTLLHNVIAVLK